MRALHAQINPHFVYNTLDAINWMAIEKDDKEISHMITALSDIMRYAISRDNLLVPIREELKWVQNYIYIQQNRFEGRFAIQFEVEEAVLDYLMQRLTLQPFVENAIYHGMEDMEEGGLIVVRATLHGEQNRIVLEISDNGKGIGEETLQHIQLGKTEGIGINNISDRLKLEYGAEYGVVIDSAPDLGTTVQIIIPCIKG